MNDENLGRLIDSTIVTLKDLNVEIGNATRRMKWDNLDIKFISEISNSYGVVANATAELIKVYKSNRGSDYGN